jgi:hypothetical protein
MKIKRILFLINSLWELARVFLLFAALAVALRRTLLEVQSSVYWLVLLGSGQLVLPAALVMLYLDPTRFAALLNLVRLGKFLGILAALLLVFLLPLSSGLLPPVGLPVPFAALPFSIVVGMTIVDLVFLFLLFLWTGTGTDPGESEPNLLADHRETIVRPPEDLPD